MSRAGHHVANAAARCREVNFEPAPGLRNIRVDDGSRAHLRTGLARRFSADGRGGPQPANLAIRHQVEIRRFRQPDAQRLPQRRIEDRVARGVKQVGQHHASGLKQCGLRRRAKPEPRDHRHKQGNRDRQPDQTPSDARHPGVAARGRFGRRTAHRRDKPVAHARHGLDVNRIFRRIDQSAAELLDRRVEAAFEIDERIFRP